MIIKYIRAMLNLKGKVDNVPGRNPDKINLNDKNGTFRFGTFYFDYNSHFLKSPTIERRLTNKEADVLKLLCINKNNILRRDTALITIWGKDDYFMGRSMDVYITKLRKFLREDPSVSITNIHNVGFMLEVKDGNNTA
jgi:two-component system OmpR family response regulator